MQTVRLLKIVCCLAVLGLLMASCAPAVAPAATPKAAPAPTEPTAPPAKPGVAPAASPTAPASTPKPASEQPGYGGTLNIGHMGDATSYDPLQEQSLQSESLVAPCYSGIVQHDPLEPSKVIGDLAERWDMSPDGMSYTFHLYKGVKWHDGSPFTSEDARFSLEVVRKPPRGVISPRQEWLKPVDKIEAPDKDTLRMTLEYPSASLLHNLGDGRMLAVPKHVFEAKGNMRKDIVGTGPFKFKSHDAGISFTVVKNADYFIRGRPYLDVITWYIISDVATRFAALRTHRVQVTPFSAEGLRPSQAGLIRRELSDKIVVYRLASLGFRPFWMLHAKAPWSDIRVRRAVELTIDRPNVIKLASEGVADVGGFVSPGAWSLPEEELLKMPGYRQPKDADITEAKRLMAEAGYAQGFKTTTLCSNRQQYARAGEVVKEQLAQIGIEITLSLRDHGAANDLLYKRNYDSAVYTTAASYDDPDQFFGQNFVTGVPRNFSDFSDEKIDKWYDEQARTLDPAKRKQIALDMQRRLHELIPCSILGWSVNEAGIWKEVRDLKPGIGIYNNLKFQDVWLAR